MRSLDLNTFSKYFMKQHTYQWTPKQASSIVHTWLFVQMMCAILEPNSWVEWGGSGSGRLLPNPYQLVPMHLASIHTQSQEQHAYIQTSMFPGEIVFTFLVSCSFGGWLLYVVVVDKPSCVGMKNEAKSDVYTACPGAVEEGGPWWARGDSVPLAWSTESGWACSLMSNRCVSLTWLTWSDKNR